MDDGVGDIVTRRRGSRQWFVYPAEPDYRWDAPQLITIGGNATAFEDTDVMLGASP